MSLLKLLFSVALLAFATLSQALEIKPYSAEALAAAQQADRPVAVHFYAPWCPTCKAQQKVLQSLQTEPGLNVTLLVADYDSEKALRQRLGVRGQSTLVVWRGQQERARVVGDITPDGLRTALKTAL